MSDIRKRKGKKGTTYQVRYPSNGSPNGYAYRAFDTLKEARAFLESGNARQSARASADIRTVAQATDLWLMACEKEGLNGREPVTGYTLQNYGYRAEFIKAYGWDKSTAELAAPDIVAFRSGSSRGT